MKTPRFNYEEMKEIDLIRQLQFSYTVAEEKNKMRSDVRINEVSTEKASDCRESDNPRSGADTDEIKRVDITQLVDVLNKVHAAKIECKSMHGSTPVVPVGEIELDKTNGNVENYEKNSESKQMSLHRLISTLKKVQANQTQDSFELSITSESPISDEPAHIKNVIESQTESDFESMLTSKIRCMDYANERLTRNDVYKISHTDAMAKIPPSSTIYNKSIKSSFSTSVEIDDFLQAPLFGETSQNTFEYLDLSTTQSVESDTKFISTSTYYPEQPSCHLVSSAIHETIYLKNTPQTNQSEIHEKNSAKSYMIPIHPKPKMSDSKHASKIDDFIKIRVPVVLGEYKIEICLEEEIFFEEEFIRIKEDSKNIVLTNCHFTPTQFSKSLGDGTCAASNGMLVIEGFIVQNIEYSAMPPKRRTYRKRTKMITLHEKISVELLIQLVQEQGININSKDIRNYGNGEN